MWVNFAPILKLVHINNQPWYIMYIHYGEVIFVIIRWFMNEYEVHKYVVPNTCEYYIWIWETLYNWYIVCTEN